METNEWIALKNDPIGENHSWPKGIDPGRIHRTMLSLLFDNLAWKQQFSKGRIEHLSIIYEDLVENTRVVMESVGRYLAGESFVLRSVTTNILMQRDANTEAIRNEFLSSPTVK
jgi:LPS sulfotransferase NodH